MGEELSEVSEGREIAVEAVPPPSSAEGASFAGVLAETVVQSGSQRVGDHQIAGMAVERSAARTMEDALQSLPGVQARSRGGDDVRLSIRGSGLQNVVFTKARGVDVLVDGFPIGGADGNFDYGLLSPIFARETRVFYGGSATRLGSLSLGGALDLVTPRGDEVRNRLRVDAGSFGFARVAGSFGFADERSDAAIQFEARREDGFRDFAAGDAQKLAIQYGQDLGGGVKNRVFFNAARVYQDVSLPITQRELERNPEQGRVNGPPGNFNINALTQPFYETQSFRLADRLTIETADDALIQAEAFYLFRDVDFRRPSLPVPPPFAYQRGPGWLEAESHDFGATLRYEKQSEFFGHTNHFVGGLRLTGMWGQEAIYPNLQTRKGAKFADGDLFASNSVLFLENAWSWNEDLDLILGLRAAYSQRNYQDRFNQGAARLDLDQRYRDLAPRLGFESQLTDQLEWFGFASRNIEPPAFGDIISIPVRGSVPQQIEVRRMKSQQSDVLETGVKMETDRFRWGATIYHAWVKDEILRYTPDPGVATVGNQVGENADKTRHYGLELAFDWTLWQDSGMEKDRDRLRLLGQYTLREHRYDNDSVFGNNSLAGVAPQLFSAELLYESANGWYAGINLSGSPVGYSIDNANTYDVNSYALLGARAGWQGENWAVFVEGRNLTDEAYAASFQNDINAGGSDQSVFFPGEGIGFSLGVERRW